MKNRLFAWINLAYRFALHVLFRMPRRALGRSRDYDTFVDTVGSEGYLPLPAEARARFPAFTQCFHCGLCSLAAPAASAWDEPWTFVAGTSRSLDRAKLVVTRLNPAAQSTAAAEVCPAGVPIDYMADTIRRMVAESEKQ